LSSVALQGTKVLQDREIRLSRLIISEDAPATQSSSVITKYTGDSTTPNWKDVEPGRVLFPLIFCENRLEPKRQVRDVVPCRDRYLWCPVYIKTPGDRKNGLQAGIHRNSTRGSHRAEGPGRLDRPRNRTWDLVQSTCTHSSDLHMHKSLGDREKVYCNAFRACST